jgi:predicted transposase/invertase (TIGR01784 family)
MANNNIITPHDLFFRSMMVEPRFIKEFFEYHLPGHIRSVINIDSIRPEKESFINEKLKEQITDLVYSAEFGDQQGYIALLVEHQSTPEKLMPFRVLQYVMAVMDYHITKTQKKILPVVVPLVYYNGWKPYNYSTNIFDLFGDKKELAEDVLWSPFNLIDLSKISDQKLKEKTWYGVTALVMKHIFEKDFLTPLKKMITDLNAIANMGEDGNIYVNKVLNYITATANIQDRQEAIQTIKNGLSNLDEKRLMTTLAEHWKQEGLQKGMEIGAEKGKLEGKAEAFKTVTMNLFGQGMSVAQIAAITGLSTQDVEQLKNKSTN